jgi:hypothetical protein
MTIAPAARIAANNALNTATLTLGARGMLAMFYRRDVARVRRMLAVHNARVTVDRAFGR